MNFNEELKKIFKSFERPPFLFIGSGISRRYLDTPDWKSLLLHIIKQYSPENYMYLFNGYLHQAKTTKQANAGNDKSFYPQIATYIEVDFNNEYFKNPTFAKHMDSYTSS